ncbi:ech-6 [Symbiodinium sp. CCMP2592]|nr:ech-6 [Symbiodinium sp. CCMP2592]
MLSRIPGARLGRSWITAVGRSQRALASDTQELVLMEPLREKGVALLTLNRPKALNALSDGLMRALAEKLQQVDGDSTLRAAVVTGTGKAFAAGADIKDANLSDLLVLEGWLQQPLLVYFINTDSSTARRAHIEQQAKDLGLPLQRFRAIDTTDIASGRFDAAYVSRQGLDPLLLSSGPDRSINGTVACFVSHASLMEQIARNYSEDRVALILEDDVLLPTDLLRRVRHVLECAPSDWSLLKVSSWGAMRQSNSVRPLRTLWQSIGFQLRGVLTMLDFQGHVTLDQYCPDLYQMREPFTEDPPPVRHCWDFRA